MVQLLFEKGVYIFESGIYFVQRLRGCGYNLQCDTGTIFSGEGSLSACSVGATIRQRHQIDHIWYGIFGDPYMGINRISRVIRPTMNRGLLWILGLAWLEGAAPCGPPHCDWLVPTAVGVVDDSVEGLVHPLPEDDCPWGPVAMAMAICAVIHRCFLIPTLTCQHRKSTCISIN